MAMGFEFFSMPRENAVNGSGGDAQQLGLHGFRNDEVFEKGQPQRQKRFETFGARLVSGLPDLPECLHQQRITIESFAAALRVSRLERSSLDSVEQTDGVLTVISAGGAKFIQHDFLLRF